MNRLMGFAFTVSLGVCTQASAAPTIISEDFALDENTANGTVIGQVFADHGVPTTTVQLDVGKQSIGNWSTRGEEYEQIDFLNAFDAPPIVLSQIQSKGQYWVFYTRNADETISKMGHDILFRPRQKNTTATGFDAILETDLDMNGGSVITSIDYVDGTESVGWLAFGTATQGYWSGIPFEVAQTDTDVTEETKAVNFTGPFYEAPNLLTTVATSNDTAQTGVGIRQIQRDRVKLYMDELDDNAHAAEAVSLMMLQGDGLLTDTSGNPIGEVGSLTFSDTNLAGAPTVDLVLSYNDPVVFIQPVGINDDIDNAVFRFTDIGSNRFSGFLHDEHEHLGSDWHGDFDLQYVVFEAGSWTIGIENYSFDITAGNESGAFAIDPDTGEIVVADSTLLDYESGVTEYSITLQVTDGNGNIGTETVTVSINNVADSLNSDASATHGRSGGDWTGWGVAAAGDVNGDGFDDVIVGAPQDDTNGNNAGRAYVLFGNSSGILADLETVESGNGGFVINGESAGDKAGFAVGGGGDINGDGLDDLVIGAPYASSVVSEEGKAYVVFGKRDTNPVELSSIATETDVGGFVIVGDGEQDHLGGTIVVGDINDDGLADIVLGEVFRKSNAGSFHWTSEAHNDKSLAHVVYGKADGAAVYVSSIIDGSYEGGFFVKKNRQVANNWLFGSQVMPVGDFNSDGLQDFIVNTGLFGDGNGIINRLVFGHPHTGAINYNTISSNGLSILPEDGQYTISSDMSEKNTPPGFITSAVGDVNADGLDDIALLVADAGCCSGWLYPRAYIVFGTTAEQDINLADIAAGQGGFVIHNDASGVTFDDGDIVTGSIGGSGDINGDGYNDIVIGDPYADTGNGRVYIVYGKNDTEAVYLSHVVNGNGGFHTGGNGGDGLGHWVASAGDINGDGIADTIFGAPDADANNLSNSGTFYVMLGKGSEVTQWGSAGDDTLTGIAGAADVLVGGAGNDTLHGMGGKDVLYGGPGHDTFIITDNEFVRIDGGNGTDTLTFDGAGLAVNLAAASQRVRSIEVFDIRGSGANVLNVNKSVSGGNRIIIKGDADDAVYSTSQQWQNTQTTETLDGITFDVYRAGSATLWLQQGLSISINSDPSISAENFTIDEYSTGGTLLGTVLADANDVGDHISFAIIAGNDAGFFNIDSATGELSISDSVNQLDYESGASYSLTVAVTDSYGATTQEIITVDVNNLSVISRRFNMDVSGGGGIWGGWGSMMSAIGEITSSGISNSMEKTIDFDDVPGLPLDTAVMDLSMKGKYSVYASADIEGGAVNAELPVELAVVYMDEVQPGGRMELFTSLSFGEGAGFTVSSPAFMAHGRATLTDYDFQVSTDLPGEIGSKLNAYNTRLRGDHHTFSTDSVGTPPSVTATGQFSAGNALRLEATIDQPEWIDERVYTPGGKKGELLSSLPLSAEKEGCIDGVFEPSHEDLYYKMGYTFTDFHVRATADLYQHFSVELESTAVLTLEDGTTYNFDPRDGVLLLTPENSQDTNGDGVIDASLKVSLNPVFTNNTDFNAILRIPFKGPEVYYNLQEALCTATHGYKYGPNGIIYEVAHQGPMIDENLILNLADANGNTDWVSETYRYSLSDIIWTEKLAFDLCNGTGTACAPAINNDPTANDVTVLGKQRQGEVLTGTYLYSDEDGDPESGSRYQWKRALNATGAGRTPISGADLTSYIADSSDAGHYLQFCVIPDDGIDAGHQACSDWVLIEGELSPGVSAGFYKALSLDGISQYARIPMYSAFNPANSSFTVETWLKMDSLTGVNQHLVQQLDLGGNGFAMLGIHHPTGTLYTWLGSALLTGTTILEQDSWHHAAVSYDHTTSTLRLYVDGELEAEETRTMVSTYGDLVLGVYKGLGSNYFAGALDETRLWTEARSQAQIQRDMKLSVAASEPSLLFHFDYDSGDSESLTDTTGNFTAELHNDPVYIHSTEHALSLDGDGDYAEVPNSTELEFGSDSFTVEAWVFADANSEGDYRNIVSKKQGTGTSAGWVLRLDNNNDSLQPAFFMGDGSQKLNLASDTPLTLQTWNHFAAVVDRATDSASLYVNGELMTTSSVSDLGSLSSGTVMRIGTWSTNTNALWVGQIDEVRVWNSAVSQADIVARMRERLDPAVDNLIAYYTFEPYYPFEESGVKDSSGNGHDGSLFGDAAIIDLGIGVATVGGDTMAGMLPGGNGVQFRLDAQPSLGQVSVDETTGSFSYITDDPYATGNDSFRFYVIGSDGNYSSSETVTLEVQ